MAIYLVTYAGLPWTRSASLQPAAQLAGALVMAIGVVAMIRVGVFQRDVSRLERFAIALLAFTIGTGLLAAMGRVDVEGDVLVPVRYSVFVAPLHVGLVTLAANYFLRRWQPVARRASINVAMTVAALALLVQQIVAGQAAVATTTAMRATIRQFVEGETTPEMREVIFDDLNQARRDLNRIRAAGLYMKAN
jgi:hypothetical protein